MRRRTTNVLAVLTAAFDRGIQVLTGAQGEPRVPTVMMGHLVFMAGPRRAAGPDDHGLAA